MVVKLLNEHFNYPAFLTLLLYKITDNTMVLSVGLAPYWSCLMYMIYVYMILNLETGAEANVLNTKFK